MTNDKCPVCGYVDCDNPAHLPPDVDGVRTSLQRPARHGLNADCLADVSQVVAEGKALELKGIPYLVDKLVPAYGGFGMLVARAKVGKTTLAYQLGAAVAMGEPFLDRMTSHARVLIVAAEDPPQYTAWLARNLEHVPHEMMTFYRGPIRLNSEGLNQIAETVVDGGYGLVLIASWQAVISGLIQHENDNAAIVGIVEHVKLFSRETGIPWLSDAHAGKGEDQADDADPSLAMRGASAAAGAADYTLSLRYADSPFSTKRRLSGKGRFVNLPSMLIDCEPDTHHYTVVGDTKNVSRETTWRLIDEMGALTETPQSAYVLAKAIGLGGVTGRSATGLRQVREALRGRPGVRTVIETSPKGRMNTLYSRTKDSHAPADSFTTDETAG